MKSIVALPFRRAEAGATRFSGKREVHCKPSCEVDRLTLRTIGPETPLAHGGGGGRGELGIAADDPYFTHYSIASDQRIQNHRTLNALLLCRRGILRLYPLDQESGSRVR